MKAIAGAIVTAAGSFTVCLASISTTPDKAFGMFAGGVVLVVGLIGYAVTIPGRKE